MHQRDMERFAFLFLCGKHDRGILLGKEKMTFSDLDRLTYITDFLGEYSCAATPQIRQTGNRLSGLAETAYASLLAQCFV